MDAPTPLALERILRKAGYFNQELPKKEVADAAGRHLDPDANTSPSFAIFRAAVLEAVAQEPRGCDPA